ncbi:DNA repair helicase XPB [Leucobacter luti]|uniref:DNA 3'-5' helicase n=1 Tax=Leucobacter luti TaxID=340320 RepID=A0A4R6S6S2_9MICO|nr:DNA repair helicase XPB [Leucobacter luti]MCW2288774.1 DNA excision repair protein ERCC-3 [Leucobacter luti]QYM75318.1 DEAD/DEAH box helicase [Leucobacter luti]TCK45074.1 DNA excision repair protein ERCC-3 [Leucobacter luti]TDP95599.1 DNA excision repair protein ERCC-3 [Leucobacter luti]
MTLGPLIVQSDHTVLLEVAHPQAEDARHELAVFAELERAPEHIHTYRVTRLGLWNARAAGHTSEEILDTLNRYAKFPVPSGVASEIEDTMRRYGRLTIERDAEGALVLRSEDAAVLREVTSAKKIAPLLGNKTDDRTYPVEAWARGELKQQLVARGWPAEDLAGYTPGEPYDIELELDGWELRDYQAKAVEAFQRGGSGVVVLPCGAGKTIVGAASMAAVGAKTLVLVTNAVSARQWRDELLRRTTLTADDIGEYSGQVKEIKPVTIATYQILTSRRKGEYAHLSLLDAQDWGVIVYDEVHLLPAPVFKLTADLQARRRLGLTATLVREDGREGDVFSLIGPKRYDAAWKDIEAQGFIAPAACFEVRVGLSESERMDYAVAEDQDRYRIASSTTVKEQIARRIIARHPGESVLVIGQYIDQLESMSETLGAPLITGQTPVDERERLFQAFRSGEEKILVVSKVANFSVDLPDASVAVQISGSFGSRQEEAQRLGRLLRPKANGATASFYTLITRDTVDQDFAQNRQRFLAEQGYAYTILDEDQI